MKLPFLKARETKEQAVTVTVTPWPTFYCAVCGDEHRYMANYMGPSYGYAPLAKYPCPDIERFEEQAL